MSKFIDLAGQKFGRLLVIKRKDNYIQPSGRGRVLWLCRCDCGNDVNILAENLKRGNSLSCGCYNRERTSKTNFKNLSGQRFGRLIADYQVGKTKGGNAIWSCTCDCGNIVNIAGGRLQNSNTLSCGCFNKEKTSERFLKDLIGQKFGKLIVLERARNHEQPSGQVKTAWLCKCDCGRKINVQATSLLGGYSKSCGCSRESHIASELKKYFLEHYNAKIEYCILKNPDTKHYLPYDMYIPLGKNTRINGIYIEINGSQHYCLNSWHFRQSKIKGTSPIDEFEHQKRKDKLKKKFAKKNGSYIEIDLRKIKSMEQAIKYIKAKEIL